MENLPAQSDTARIENAVMHGDLKSLTPDERLQYHAAVCERAGLNPLASGLQYITLNGRLVLYAGRDTANALAAKHGLTLTHKIDTGSLDGMVLVHATATDGSRSVEDTGFAAIAGLKGDALGNAVLKAVTKAHRRAALGFAGLGLLDETEVASITDHVIAQPAAPAQAQQERPTEAAGWTAMYRREYDGEHPQRSSRLVRILNAANADGYELTADELMFYDKSEADPGFICVECGDRVPSTDEHGGCILCAVGEAG